MALLRQNRLRNKKDIDAVFKEGRALKGTYLLIKYKKNLFTESRFGIVMSLKTVGNVVTRNRIKRALSEVIRLNIKNIKISLDVVITVLKKGNEDVLRNEMLKLLGI